MTVLLNAYSFLNQTIPPGPAGLPLTPLKWESLTQPVGAGLSYDPSTGIVTFLTAARYKITYSASVQLNGPIAQLGALIGPAIIYVPASKISQEIGASPFSPPAPGSGEVNIRLSRSRTRRQQAKHSRSVTSDRKRLTFAPIILETQTAA